MQKRHVVDAPGAYPLPATTRDPPSLLSPGKLLKLITSSDAGGPADKFNRIFAEHSGAQRIVPGHDWLFLRVITRLRIQGARLYLPDRKNQRYGAILIDVDTGVATKLL